LYLDDKSASFKKKGKMRRTRRVITEHRRGIEAVADKDGMGDVSDAWYGRLQEWR
jgi:hypothetical protein